MYSLSPSVLSPAQPGGREGGREEGGGGMEGGREEGGGGMEGAGKERGSEEKRLHFTYLYRIFLPLQNVLAVIASY